MRDYMFRIAIDGKIAVTVGVFVTNIDDNDPMIEMFAPCEIDVSDALSYTLPFKPAFM